MPSYISDCVLVLLSGGDLAVAIVVARLILMAILLVFTVIGIELLGFDWSYLVLVGYGWGICSGAYTLLLYFHSRIDTEGWSRVFGRGEPQTLHLGAVCTTV